MTLGLDQARLGYDNQAIKVPTANPKGAAHAKPGAHQGGASAQVDRKASDPKLYEQCQEFESLFVKMMLSEMRKSVDKAGLVDGGMAEDIFQDMLYDEYALSMAKNGGFGLANQVYDQLAAVDSYRKS